MPAVIHQGFRNWWQGLSDDWKKVVNQCILQRGEILDDPNDEQVDYITATPVLRIVGPTGPNPNLSFELTDMEPISYLKHLSLLVITYHQIESIEALAGLDQIGSLFVHNNKIEDLSPIRDHTGITQLYMQANQISDIYPLKKLSGLNTLVCNYNKISDIGVLGRNSHPHLKHLMLTPNEGLKLDDVQNLSSELNIKIH